MKIKEFIDFLEKTQTQYGNLNITLDTGKVEFVDKVVVERLYGDPKENNVVVIKPYFY